MKLITFAVPCYNSAEYLERCVESLIPGGNEIEIILVNDGSTDQTPKMCDDYAEKYPEIITVIHKENGGHGDAVMAGLNAANGKYFKVVDSDDWLNIEALNKIIDQLRIFIQNDKNIDMLLSNYVYEHLWDNTSKVMDYKNVFPQDRIFSWNDCSHFRLSQYIIMHSIIYRTQILKESGLKLPKHTFYVDNIYVYQPLPYVEKIYYMDLDLYRYFIGRSDQSVNEEVMVERACQYLKVTEIMLEAHDLEEVDIDKAKLAKYMKDHLSMVIAITSVLLFLKDTEKSKQLHRELWNDLAENHRDLYYKIKYFSPLFSAASRNELGRKLAIAIYRLSRKIYHFN